MNVSDEKIRKDLASLDSENLEQALYYIGRCGMAINDYLADVIASLCGISAKEMLSDTNATHLAQPRWLYWYAYRYMTGESFLKMTKVLKVGSKTFTEKGIQGGVEKMSAMIESEPIWGKRWSIVKRIIKLNEETKENISDTIVINVPKNIKDKVNIVIKTK